MLLIPPIHGFSGKVSSEGLDFIFPLEGLVDKSAEQSRLKGEIKKLTKDLQFVEKRLSNKRELHEI